eukprot:Hpha_TRINITY_DN16934_c0_g1::TRINITY_DN16934_c0_g1_i1::g.53265::m.53265
MSRISRAVQVFARGGALRAFVVPAFRTPTNAPRGPWGKQLRWGSESAHIVHMEQTPNPDSMKFLPEDDSITLAPEGVTLDFASERAAEKSPLAKVLFEVEGVKSVFIGPNWLTVSKYQDLEWDELEGPVIGKIREFLATGLGVVGDDFEANADTKIYDDDAEDVQAIKELITSRIRPMVQGDGGDVKYVGFEDGVVLLLMQGACQSCPSSGATLKGGIERMLMHWIPEVLEVRAVDEEFAEEYILEQDEIRKRYVRDPKTGKLVARQSPEVAETLSEDMNTPA